LVFETPTSQNTPRSPHHNNPMEVGGIRLRTAHQFGTGNSLGEGVTTEQRATPVPSDRLFATLPNHRKMAQGEQHPAAGDRREGRLDPPGQCRDQRHLASAGVGTNARRPSDDAQRAGNGVTSIGEGSVSERPANQRVRGWIGCESGSAAKAAANDGNKTSKGNQAHGRRACHRRQNRCTQRTSIEEQSLEAGSSPGRDLKAATGNGRVGG
jgi:hypothetical protein